MMNDLVRSWKHRQQTVDLEYCSDLEWYLTLHIPYQRVDHMKDPGLERERERERERES